MSRVQAGLPAAGFVFCSFNNIYKTTPAEFDVWMSLLRRVEGSVMWMNKPNKQAQENLEKQAIKRGVSANRLVFAGRVPKAEYHVRLALGDLFLDAFTYNAHSTAVDAMWAGLPIISKAGEGMAARAGVSVLTAMGVPELVVNSVRDYEDLAFALATDHQKLRELKSRLSHSRSNGPFFDAQGFARHVESAYAQAHARYAAGHEPSAITVAP
jgi:protein O-GlcNAc transferase